MRPNFEAEIKGLLAAVRTGMDTVVRESAQELISVAQTTRAEGGHMPVRDGFLRASLIVSTAASPPPLREKPKGKRKYTYSGGVHALAIAEWDLRRPLLATYTANYARPVHYGANGRPGVPWVDLAAQRWPQIVAEAAKNQLQRSK